MPQEDIIEFPRFWTEKLKKMQVHSSLPVDKKSTVTTAIERNFKGTKKEFKVRRVPETGELRVWRLK